MRALAFAARIPWAKVGGWLLKAKIWLIALLKPLGVWGLCGLAIVDSSSIPLPFLDPLVVSYGVGDHKRFLLYSFMAALGSAIGSMLPYYLGRAGGELFLLKRINRERYEQLRDRFEKQEFLAIMLPAMMPPPMPVKLFELAAGVFEMRPLSYFLAICSGKFLRFAIESIIVIIYGPAILHTGMQAIHRHAGWVMTGVGLLLLLLIVWVMRKSMSSRNRRESQGEDEEEGLG
ncbi:membrane protein YqaA, SNARE-associated domain [Granulicella rosea]|uniref:Membrane protein YqaA, SNARE-associated domain n=1 Tax=Granulicella rosea TaxID=474952 RepID=A0A239LQ76_9BACT|nr:VTT domain-containing protein [Granulicella rosea]SNT31953.1 membrane protein YqaA, SNARE-associated domain [Granulicella rosea]